MRHVIYDMIERIQEARNLALLICPEVLEQFPIPDIRKPSDFANVNPVTAAANCQAILKHVENMPCGTE